MLKQITFLFLFFAINVSFAQDFVATQKVPDSVFTGSSFIVTTTIHSGHKIDFMKFLQPLPGGFTATDIDSKGGAFEFSKNEVKIVWLAPPMEETFSISFQIKVPVYILDAQTSSGRIIYITSNNEHKIYVLQTKKIMLINTGAKAATINTPNAVGAKPGIVRTSSSENFFNENGKPVEGGFYVVLSTFSNKENAERARAANIMRGHLNTKIIQNQSTLAYNVFALRTNNKADADVERLKFKTEYKDAWILNLQQPNSVIATESGYMPPLFAEKNRANGISSTGGIVRTSRSDYFLDENGKPAAKEFYIVIGTFSNKENADRFRAENINKGHLNAQNYQNQVTKAYKTIVFRTNNSADADAEHVKYQLQYPDAWILKLE